MINIQFLSSKTYFYIYLFILIYSYVSNYCIEIFLLNSHKIYILFWKEMLNTKNDWGCSLPLPYVLILHLKILISY